MAFQPSMFLFGSRSADLHWSAGCSRALLANSSPANKLTGDELANALLLHQHQQQQLNCLSTNNNNNNHNNTNKNNHIASNNCSINTKSTDNNCNQEQRQKLANFVDYITGSLQNHNQHQDEEDDEMEELDEQHKLQHQRRRSLSHEDQEDAHDDDDSIQDGHHQHRDHDDQELEHEPLERHASTVDLGLEPEAEQETALNLSLHSNRNQPAAAGERIKSEHLKMNSYQEHHKYLERPSQQQAAAAFAYDSQKSGSFITSLSAAAAASGLPQTNGCSASSSLAHLNQVRLATDLEPQAQFNHQQATQQQLSQRHSSGQATHHHKHHPLNSYSSTGSSTAHSTTSSASSSSASSTSSSSSSGWSSAADSPASCSPKRVADLSSPISTSSLLQVAARQHQLQNSQQNQHQQHPEQALAHQQQRDQQHQQNPSRPLFLHHHHHHHHHHHELGPVHKADSDDLEKIRNFIEQFKARRGALGLTQKQAAQCFRAFTNDRYAFSDNFVGHFEGFQFRPQTAMTIADSLAEWLEYAENETRSGRQLSFMPGKVKETRKRKYEVIRIRDSAKRVLVEAFEKNKSPSTSELEQLSRKTNIPSRNIEIFFKNRRTSRQYHQ